LITTKIKTTILLFCSGQQSIDSTVSWPAVGKYGPAEVGIGGSSTPPRAVMAPPDSYSAPPPVQYLDIDQYSATRSGRNCSHGLNLTIATICHCLFAEIHFLAVQISLLKTKTGMAICPPLQIILTIF
jgi:hypothetical protein